MALALCVRSAKPAVAAQYKFALVKFQKGVLGAQKNIFFSPQHRVLVQGWQSELLFGPSEILVPAVALVNGTSVTRAPRAKVTYVQLMFDRHQLVTCSGFVSESFFPHESDLRALTGMQAETQTFFPRAIAAAHGKSGFVRPVEEGRMTQLLGAV